MYVDRAGNTVTIPHLDEGDHVMICFCVTSAGTNQYAIRLTISEQEIQSTIDGHCNAFEYTGAIPKSIVPDNQKTAVICNHCCHIELSLFNSFENMPGNRKNQVDMYPKQSDEWSSHKGKPAGLEALNGEN